MLSDYDSWKLASPYEDDVDDGYELPDSYEDDPVDSEGRRL